MRALGLAVVLSACGTDLGSPTDTGPFDQETVTMCGATTSALGAYTRGGGRLAIELDRPGCAPTSCAGSDVYAAESWATIRIAGPDLLLEGCEPVSAVGAEVLRVTFTPPSGEAEQNEIPLVGDCIAGPGCAASDGG